MKDSCQAPWSPLACEPGPDGTVREVRCYTYWDGARRAYVAFIVPETIERVERQPGETQGPQTLVIRTSKSGTVRAYTQEANVKRYSRKTHASHAANIDKQAACQWAEHVGYKVKP